MQIVIEIPEEYYNAIKSIPDRQCLADMLIIKNGTPLPKGHGRLIDKDHMLARLEAASKFYGGECADAFDERFAQGLKEAAIKVAEEPTIVEASKTEAGKDGGYRITDREEQAIVVLNTLHDNPLLSDIHRQALEVGIMAIKALDQEPKTGHWKDCGEREPWYRCSECRRRVWGGANHYCPECGAKMKSEDKE